MPRRRRPTKRRRNKRSEFDGNGKIASLGAALGAGTGYLYTPFVPQIGGAIGGGLGYAAGGAVETVGGVAADVARVPYDALKNTYGAITGVTGAARGGYNYLMGIDADVEIKCSNGECNGPYEINIAPNVKMTYYITPQGYAAGFLGPR